MKTQKKIVKEVKENGNGEFYFNGHNARSIEFTETRWKILLELYEQVRRRDPVIAKTLNKAIQGLGRNFQTDRIKKT